MDESRRGDPRPPQEQKLPELDWGWDDNAVLYLLKNDYQNSLVLLVQGIDLIDKKLMSEEEFWSDFGKAKFETFEEYTARYAQRWGDGKVMLKVRLQVGPEVQKHIDKVNILAERGNAALLRRDLEGVKSVIAELMAVRNNEIPKVSKPDILRNSPKPKV